MKLFPNFTRHYMITHTELNFNIIVDHKNVKQNKTKKNASVQENLFTTGIGDADFSFNRHCRSGENIKPTPEVT